MKQYIKKYSGIVFCLACILLVGALVYKQFIQTQNIFDQMYYTRIRNHYDWWEGALGGFGNEMTSFQNMPQIEPISRDTESYYTAEGYFENDYSEEYLSDGESLAIVFSRNEETMEIIAVKRFDEFRIVFRYIYDVKRKQLHEAVECVYSKNYSGELDENQEEFNERTKNMEEILLIIGEHGLKKEDLLQYKKYLLHDKLLTDWLEANISRFSVSRWGRVEYIEVLPLETGE